MSSRGIFSMLNNNVLCVLAFFAIHLIVYYAPGVLSMNAQMLVLAPIIVYFGCHMSLDRQEGDVTTKSSDAMGLPLVAFGGLATFFVAFKYFDASMVNRVLGIYFLVLGVPAVGGTFRALLPSWVISLFKRRLRTAVASSATAVQSSSAGEGKEKGDAKAAAAAAAASEEWNLLDVEIPWLGRVTIPLLEIIFGAPVCIGYALSKHWILNNILGACFCVSGLARLAIGSYGTGAMALAGLFFYDIIMVFYTPMMVEVATKLDGPIKLLFPRGYADARGEPAFALLGLGDLIVPGIFLSLLLRLDALAFLRAQLLGRGKKGEGEAAEIGDPQAAPTAAAPPPLIIEGVMPFADFSKPLFMVTWVAYTAGLALTVYIMHTFQAAQPALLYLVPAVLIASGLWAAYSGRLAELWNYEDDAYDLMFADAIGRKKKVEGEETVASAGETTVEQQSASSPKSPKVGDPTVSPASSATRVVPPQ